MPIRTWYRGYDKSFPNYGTRDGWGLWLTDDPGYAGLYPAGPLLPKDSPLRGTASFTVDTDGLRLLSEGDVYDFELDAWTADPDTCRIISAMGFDGWTCHYDETDACGLCIVNPEIIKKIVTTQ